MPPIVNLPGGGWRLTSDLDAQQLQRLRAALAQGGMPRLFWPGVEALVRDLCGEVAARGAWHEQRVG